MRIKLMLCILLVFGIVLPQTVLALPTGFRHFDIRTSMAGDRDGLGLDLRLGEEFNFTDLPLSSFTTPSAVPAADSVFDTWAGGRRNSVISWTQDGFENFDVFAAFAVIGSGGWGGVAGAPALQLEGRHVGNLSVNEVENSYTLSAFYLRPSLYRALQQPTVDFSFATPFNESADWYDEGAIDFSAIFAIGRPGKGRGRHAPAPVPEPATVLLLGSGILGAVLFRRRSK